MPCDLCPYGATPSHNRTLWTIVAHRYWDLRWKDPTSSLWRLHAPIRRLPNWVPPWTATQSFQDDQYGLGRMRELEESFLDVGFNPYGLNQTYPDPVPVGTGYVAPWQWLVRRLQLCGRIDVAACCHAMWTKLRRQCFVQRVRVRECGRGGRDRRVR